MLFAALQDKDAHEKLAKRDMRLAGARQNAL
jgi:hypothetical protein